ncbi:MAG: TfoX/Sxy family protein [Desulfobulbaceae bacterium]|nr:TfoX/Sxy family protein [Desulfobulbaceae bacterium]
MAYDQGLAQRVRELLEERRGYHEKKMFGGICFLLYGNMTCGILKDDLIVRVGPAAHAEALRQPETRPFDLTGRSMSGWVMVGPAGCEGDEDLSSWVEKGAGFAGTLPPKGK